MKSVVPFPLTEELEKQVGIPNVTFPSDHIPCVAEISWNKWSYWCSITRSQAFVFSNLQPIDKRSIHGVFKKVETTVCCKFCKWANSGLFLFIFVLFNNNFNSKIVDYNSDRRSRMCARWPLYRHCPCVLQVYLVSLSTLSWQHLKWLNKPFDTVIYLLQRPEWGILAYTNVYNLNELDSANGQCLICIVINYRK